MYHGTGPFNLFTHSIKRALEVQQAMKRDINCPLGASKDKGGFSVLSSIQIVAVRFSRGQFSGLSYVIDCGRVVLGTNYKKRREIVLSIST